MEENNKYPNPSIEDNETEIDLMEYALKLWAARKLLLKVFGIAILVGLVIAFTTPRQYTVNVKLAPELGNSKGGGALSSITSMLGMSGMNMGGSEADALNVTLYPDVVASTPFMMDMLDTQVKTMDEEEPDTTLIEYLKTERGSLASTVMSLPGKAIGAIMSLIREEEEGIGSAADLPLRLTKEQSKCIEALRKTIVASVDKKTGVTSLSVTMQDPQVAAIVTDTVLNKLKEHIINYRISKVAEDCNYYEKMYEESKQEYYKAQQKYAYFIDSNKNINLKSVQIESDRLQNEMNLAYNLYNQMATQLQIARAKIQEVKPMFAVVEPAIIPIKPSGTGRSMILLGVVFLALAAASACRPSPAHPLRKDQPP